MEKSAVDKKITNKSNVTVLSVLHVDDDLGFLEVSRQILEINGKFKIDSVSSVEEAFQKMEAKKFDAIISDFEMPRQDGLLFLKLLRDQQNEIPFVLFTGKGREDVAIKALNLGSDAYINKTGDIETVYGELSDALLKSIERKKSKKLLADSELKYRKLISGLLQGLMIIQGSIPHIVFANSEMENITGYSPEQLISFSPSEIENMIHPEDRANSLDRLRKRLVGEELDSCYEFRGIRKDGSVVWLETCVSLIDYNDQPAVQSVYLDITERKKTEAALKESEAKYRSIFDNSEAGMFRTKLDGSAILDCNPKFLDIFGRARDEVIGKPSVMHWADLKEREDLVRQLKEKGHIHDFECKMLDKKGEVKTCITSLKLYPEQGILEGSIIDISERKKAENALKESQHLIEKILNTTPTLIYIYDLAKNQNVYANREILYFLGYSTEQIHKMGSNLFAQTLHPDDASRVAKHHAKLSKAKGDERFELEYRMQHSNGEWRWLHSIDIPFSRKQDGVVTQILGSAEDVTERRKAEEALADSEAKYRAVVNNAEDTILLSDLRGRHIYRNPAYFRSLGYKEDESVDLDGYSQVYPDDLPLLKRKMTELLKTGSSTAEYRVKHKDGSWVYRLAKSTIIYNRKNEPYAILSIIRDTTENKKAEQALRESEQKYQLLNEKLNIVGAFVRHDIRNKLAVISGNAYLARRTVSGNDACKVKLDQIDSTVGNIVRILDFSKDYESLGSKALYSMNLGNVIDFAATTFSNLKGIEIVNECKNYSVVADDMLSTVFHNLIENSLKYGEKVTKIRVHVKQTASNSTIIYEDDGVGLDDSVKPRLFEKGVGKGTGYGLYLIKRTCELYGWTVKENGLQGKGARFEITIPKNKNQ